jgi:hypothetical protein
VGTGRHKKPSKINERQYHPLVYTERVGSSNLSPPTTSLRGTAGHASRGVKREGCHAVARRAKADCSNSMREN